MTPPVSSLARRVGVATSVVQVVYFLPVALKREKPFHQERPALFVASPNHNPKLPILSISYLSRFLSCPAFCPAVPLSVPLSLPPGSNREIHGCRSMWLHTATRYFLYVHRSSKVRENPAYCAQFQTRSSGSGFESRGSHWLYLARLNIMPARTNLLASWICLHDS